MMRNSQPRRLHFAPVIALAILTVVVADYASGQSEPDEVLLSGDTMGTTWSIREVVDETTSILAEREFNKRLVAINKSMSTWDPTSEISRFNASESLDWFSVSESAASVVAEAIRIAEITDGAFDPTVAPMIDLWNFGSTPGEFEIPTEEQIAAVRAYVGFDKLEVRMTPPAIRKRHPQLQLNLSAIAKGYGVDTLANMLRSDSAASKNFLCEIGGEIVANGSSLSGDAWRVGIEAPISGQRSVLTINEQSMVVPLKNMAMATSGDYRNYFEAGGVRYSHTIDPTTGTPVTHDMVSVTVLHRSCMTADAFATALLVMGPDDGYNLAVQRGIPVMMVMRRNGHVIEKHTPSFPTTLSVKPTTGRASAMKTLLIAAVVFLLAVSGMAVGVIFSNKRLKGSCGGLSSMQNGDTKPMCELCSIPPEQCDTFRKAVTATDTPTAEG